MKKIIVYSVLAILMVITLLFALTHGASQVSFNHLTASNLNILFNIRLPRIFSALIAGSALSVSGALFQASLRNPIADPGIMGVNSAACLFQSLAMLILPGIFFTKIIFAIIGGLGAFFLLLFFQKQMNPYRLIIVGVALDAVFAGINQILSAKSALSLATATWTSTFYLAVLGIIGLIFALIFAQWGNYLKVNDLHLKSLGLSPQKMRIILMLIATLLASVVSATIGMLAFIGIIVPQIGRQLIGHDYRELLPFSVFAGSWLLLFVDTLGRTINPPNEIAANVLLAIIGGPFMILILYKTSRGERHV